MHQIYNIPCPILKMRFGLHDEMREKTLQLIDQMNAGSYQAVDDHGYLKTNISKCDWNVSREEPREYLNYIQEAIYKEHAQMFFDRGFQAVKMINMWFQQYEKNASHEWHVHTQCQWSSVYYLEYPEGSPKTVFVNPLNNDGTFDIDDVEEGDILTFPSFIIHCAPEIKDDKRKTILSFNTDVSLSTDPSDYE